MTGYYAQKLAGERLRACYAVAPPRTRQYLAAEVDFVRDRVEPGDRVLELGCGYGRVLEALIRTPASRVTGLDSARESLGLARTELGNRADLLLADASRTGLRDHSFDLVLCIQNGISAFKVDPLALALEAVRVTRPGGRVLFSTYAERFWTARLAWFEAQAAAGLLGEIDREATGDGVIVCRDGFRATTFSPEQFRALAGSLALPARLAEIDGSSLFCEIEVS